MKSVVIFSKYPSPGTVKTRLTLNTCLNLDDTAIIAEAMLKDTILTCIGAEVDEIILGFYPKEKKSNFNRLINEMPEITENFPIFTFYPQDGPDFDARFSSIITQVRQKTSGSLVVVGADLPYLPSSLIIDALNFLDIPQNNRSIVIGPANGGGIYLVGFTPEFNPTWFSEYKLFGGGIEIEQFSRVMTQKEFKIAVWPPMGDIDVEEDLVSLILYIKLMEAGNYLTGIKFPKYTAQVIRQLGLIVEDTRDSTRRRKIKKINI
jgi:glycosyltransferase A (GT-A) superfamily protein (DUF2064 family)